MERSIAKACFSRLETPTISMARSLAALLGPVSRLIADKGYDTNHLRTLLADRGTEAVIPSTSSRRTPIPYDVQAYKARNLVERLWCRLPAGGASPHAMTSLPAIPEHSLHGGDVLLLAQLRADPRALLR